MAMDRIRNRVRSLLNEAPDWFDAEDEEDVLDDPDAYDQEKAETPNVANYGAGIRPSKSEKETLTAPGEEPEGTLPKGKIIPKSQGSTFDRSTIRDRRKKIAADTEASLEYNPKLASAIEQWTMTSDEKRKAIEDRLASKDFTAQLQGEKGEKPIQGLREIFISTKNEQNRIASEMLKAIDEYNKWIHENKQHILAAPGGTLSDDALSLPISDNIRNSNDSGEIIRAVVGTILNKFGRSTGDHIIRRFLADEPTAPEVPDITSPEEAQKKLDDLLSHAEVLGRSGKRTNLIRKINSVKKLAKGGLDKTINIKGKKTKIPVAVKMLQVELEDLLSNEEDLTEGINAPPAADKDRTEQIDKYYRLMHSDKFAATGARLAKIVQRLMQLKKEAEINAAMAAGLARKFKKLGNLANTRKKSVPPQPGTVPQAASPALSPEDVREILMDPSDFDPDQDIIIVPDESDLMMESVIKVYKEMLVEQKKKPEPEYKRQRGLTRKSKLKEVWKEHQEKIRKKHIEQQQKKDDMPDIHLGGLS